MTTLPPSQERKKLLYQSLGVRHRHLIAPLVVAAIVGWGACGGDDEGQGSTVTGSTTSATDAATGSGGMGAGTGGSTAVAQGGAAAGGMGQGGVDSGGQQACRSCAMSQFSGSGPCLSKLTTCKADPTCTVWADCLLLCTNSDYSKSCYDSCGAPPDQAATELKNCMCSACSDVCVLPCSAP